MTKLRQVLSTFSAFSERWRVVGPDALVELDLSDQELAEELYRRSERSDSPDPV